MGRNVFETYLKCCKSASHTLDNLQMYFCQYRTEALHVSKTNQHAVKNESIWEVFECLYLKTSQTSYVYISLVRVLPTIMRDIFSHYKDLFIFTFAVVFLILFIYFFLCTSNDNNNQLV